MAGGLAGFLVFALGCVGVICFGGFAMSGVFWDCLGLVAFLLWRCLRLLVGGGWLIVG